MAERRSRMGPRFPVSGQHFTATADLGRIARSNGLPVEQLEPTPRRAYGGRGRVAGVLHVSLKQGDVGGRHDPVSIKVSGEISRPDLRLKQHEIGGIDAEVT